MIRMDYKIISKNRNMLMGLAMIMIMIFHTTIKLPVILDLIKNFGDFGVNIFFLISGFSMCYAWKKDPNLKHFYRKRFSRIMITYLPIAIVWCSISVLMQECGIIEAICKILTIQFWIDGNLLHWFVSGLLVLYLITPFWMKLCEKYPHICMAVTIAICILCTTLPILGIFRYRLIFVYRIPTYFIGLYMGYTTYCKIQPGKIETIAINIFGILGIVLFACIKFDTLNYTWKHIFYLLLTPAVVLWVAYLLDLCKGGLLVNVLTFCGAITLETYLLHEKILKIESMVFNRLHIQLDGYNIIINVLGAFMAISAAYVYNKAVNKIMKK